jgi:hypothetical protein
MTATGRACPQQPIPPTLTTGKAMVISASEATTGRSHRRRTDSLPCGSTITRTVYLRFGGDSLRFVDRHLSCLVRAATPHFPRLRTQPQSGPRPRHASQGARKATARDLSAPGKQRDSEQVRPPPTNLSSNKTDGPDRTDASGFSGGVLTWS